MKKQNVNNKLAFGKATVTELNDQKLIDVKGGTYTNDNISLVSLGCFLCINSSKGFNTDEFQVL